jgi:hypothetical protein
MEKKVDMNMSYFNHRLLVCFIVLACQAYPIKAHAGEDNTAILRRQIESLSQSVKRLEQRVADLEKRTCTPEAAHPLDSSGLSSAKGPAEPKSVRPSDADSCTEHTVTETQSPRLHDHLSIRQRWQRIDRRMTAKQVEQLLGTPQQQFPAAGKIVWYYQYPNNRRGSITFFQDMRVAGWQAPPKDGL